MSDDYTPTTEDIQAPTAEDVRSYLEAEGTEDLFDCWLAAHDAEKRAEWEAERGETESGGWEYKVSFSEDSIMYLGSDETEAREVAAFELHSTIEKQHVTRGPWQVVTDCANEGDSSTRECSRCTSEIVHTAPGVNECESCLFTDRCSLCDQDIQGDDMHASGGVCGSCNHDADRSGS